MATLPHQVEKKKQRPSPWGLMRISSGRPTPTDQPEYLYDDNACGEGVTIYILGGTILSTHVDFNYPTPVIYDESDTDKESKSKKYPNPRIGLPSIDGIDYGTFVAGIAAGSGSGVAKKATIVQVPVNDITKATEKILLDKKALMADAPKDKAYPAVVNISTGYVDEKEVNDSLVKLIEQGIHVVVAAGDDGKPLPKLILKEEDKQKHIESVIWVGASTREDERWKSSNYGPRIDLFAPGKDIPSATRSKDNIYSATTHSGTAFAAPHVTGIIACLLSHPSYGGHGPKEMKDKILTMAEQTAIMHVSLQKSLERVLAAESISCITHTRTETDLGERFKAKASEIVNEAYIDKDLLPLLKTEAPKIWEVFEEVGKNLEVEIEKTLGKEDIQPLEIQLPLDEVKSILGSEISLEVIVPHYVETEDKLRQLLKAKALELVKEAYVDKHLWPLIKDQVQEIKKVVENVSKRVETTVNGTWKDENVLPSAKDLFTTTPKLASCRLDSWGY